MTDESILKVSRLDTGYGKKQVIFDLSFDVKRGEIVALIGPNGAGKSTVLKTIFGLTRNWAGDIHFDGTAIQGASPVENVRRGLLFLPQGNRVFLDLTVYENLELGGYGLKKTELEAAISTSLELFPLLKSKLRQNAGTLSGGEQQMLALARAWVSKPKLMMLDEPSLGLSPGLVEILFKLIARIGHDEEVSILILTGAYYSRILL